MIAPLIHKSACSELNYAFDWGAWLSGSALIETVNYIQPVNDHGFLVENIGILDGRYTVFRLSGGQVGNQYEFTIKVDCDNGDKECMQCVVEVDKIYIRKRQY